MLPPDRPLVEAAERLSPGPHVWKSAEPHETVRVLHVAELAQQSHASRLLRGDEFAFEQADEVVAPARPERVLPELDDRIPDAGHHDSLRSRNSSVTAGSAAASLAAGSPSRLERLVQHVGDRRAAEFGPQSLLGAGVDAVQGGPDAPADGALEVRLGVVQSEQRRGLDGVIHVEHGDVLRAAGQAPARAGATADRDQPGPAQIAEATPDDHGVRADAGRDLVRRQLPTTTLLGQRQPGQGVHRNREPAVRGHDPPSVTASNAVNVTDSITKSTPVQCARRGWPRDLCRQAGYAWAHEW